MHNLMTQATVSQFESVDFVALWLASLLDVYEPSFVIDISLLTESPEIR